jgi:hypothetical protein
MNDFYKKNIYDRYNDLIKFNGKINNNTLSKIFEWYSCIQLTEEYNKQFFHYEDIDPTFKEENRNNLCHLLEETEWLNKKIVVFSIGKKIKQITGIKKNTKILSMVLHLLCNYEEIIEVNDVKNYIEQNYDFLKNYKKEYLEI